MISSVSKVVCLVHQFGNDRSERLWRICNILAYGIVYTYHEELGERDELLGAATIREL